jgi:hypothetical protein
MENYFFIKKKKQNFLTIYKMKTLKVNIGPKRLPNF